MFVHGTFFLHSKYPWNNFSTQKMSQDAVAPLGIVITVIGVVYNVPFTWRVWRTGSAKDIDPWFLLLRIVNSILTIAYGGVLRDPYIITTNAIPLLSSIIVLLIRTNGGTKCGDRGKSGGATGGGGTTGDDHEPIAEQPICAASCDADDQMLCYTLRTA